MKNKIKVILLLICSIFLLSACSKKGNNNNETNIAIEEKKEFQQKNLEDLEIVKNKYNLVDEDIEKTEDGHIICRGDENCIDRFFMECKSSNGIYLDKSNGVYFIFITRGYIRNKCLVDILGGTVDYDDYSCELSEEDVNLEVLKNIKVLDFRKTSDLCNKIEIKNE